MSKCDFLKFFVIFLTSHCARLLKVWLFDSSKSKLQNWLYFVLIESTFQGLCKRHDLIFFHFWDQNNFILFDYNVVACSVASIIFLFFCKTWNDCCSFFVQIFKLYDLQFFLISHFFWVGLLGKFTVDLALVFVSFAKKLSSKCSQSPQFWIGTHRKWRRSSIIFEEKTEIFSSGTY